MSDPASESPGPTCPICGQMMTKQIDRSTSITFLCAGGCKAAVVFAAVGK